MIKLRILTTAIIVSVVTFFIVPAYATDYYVDGKIGDDLNSGFTPAEAWRTIARVNQATLHPNDTIRFKRGQSWREQLTVPSSGSEIGGYITFAAYGNGSNPIIRSSELITSWIDKGDNLYRGRHNPPYEKWNGQFGACDSSGHRITQYWKTEIDGSAWNPPGSVSAPESDIANIKANFEAVEPKEFWSPGNSPYFYVRTQTGTPGKMEVGARNWCIDVDGNDYIFIDSLDCYGPNGNNTYDASDVGGIDLNNSSNIKLKNLNIKHVYGSAVRAHSVNFLTIDNITIDDSTTGIYFRGSGKLASAHGEGAVIRNSIFTNISTVRPERGDNNFVGINNSEWITIENNSFAYRGYTDLDGRIDAGGIVACCGSNNIVIRSNKLTRPGISGIVIAGTKLGSTGFEITGNTIDTWGHFTLGYAPGDKNYAGIYVGGGHIDNDMTDIKVHDNTLINGKDRNEGTGHTACISINYYNLFNLQVSNNVCRDNTTDYDLYWNPRNQSGNVTLNYNEFYRPGGAIVSVFGKNKSSMQLNKYTWSIGNIVEAGSSFKPDLHLRLGSQ